MQVVIIASKDSIDPTALSCRSVTVATPTPRRSTERDIWILRLQSEVRNMLADFQKKKMIAEDIMEKMHKMYQTQT